VDSAFLRFPWPVDLLTLDEWDALPETDWPRLELVEGLLTITASLPAHHQGAVMDVCIALDAQLPDELIAIHRMSVGLGDEPPTVRIPDVLVARAAATKPDTHRFAPNDLALVVEILSDGTRRIDRVLKFAEYAEAGIPQYWIVDIAEPPTLLAYSLVDGAYELSTEASGRTVLDVAGHPVELDLDALATR
jgi:Uma2 family endonuclease